MLSSYLLMQNSIFQMNNAQLNMFRNSDLMSKSISFGESQPLKPSFAQNYDMLELSNKANETKVSVLRNFIKAMEEKLGKDIAKSTPKYAGINYKA